MKKELAEAILNHIYEFCGSVPDSECTVKGRTCRECKLIGLQQFDIEAAIELTKDAKPSTIPE